MATTIFIPEVFADAVNAKLGTTLRFGSVAFDATSLVPDIMNAGDTMHFPKLKRTATIENIVKGTALTPAVIDMTDDTAEIKYIGSAFRVYDSEMAMQGISLSDDGYDSLDITFNVNRPVDTQSLINELKTQYDIGAISKQTIIDISPYTTDTSLELQRIEAEKGIVTI